MNDLNQIKDNIENMHRNLEEIFEIIFKDAVKYENMYKQAMNEAGKRRVKSEFASIGTRVRRKGNSFTAEWNKKTFYTSRDSKTKKVYSEYLRMNKDGCYSETIFKDQPEWSRDVGLIVERRYKFLRKQSALLSDIRRKLKEFDRLLEKTVNESGN